jgi:uncharacterized protein YoxC
MRKKTLAFLEEAEKKLIEEIKESEETTERLKVKLEQIQHAKQNLIQERDYINQLDLKFAERTLNEAFQAIKRKIEHLDRLNATVVDLDSGDDEEMSKSTQVEAAQGSHPWWTRLKRAAEKTPDCPAYKKQ